MIRKIVLITCLILLSNAACGKCVIDARGTKDIVDAVAQNGFYFKKFNEVCGKLNRANARVNVSGGFFTFDGKNVVSVVVQLMDKQVNLIPDGYYSVTVKIDKVADDRNKTRMLSEAINEALETWQLDDAIKNLQQQREKFGVIK